MLAGFCVGLAVAAVGEPKRMAKQVFALTNGFFTPIFFVWLGASLNLRDLSAHPQAVGLGLALGIAALVVYGALAVALQPFPVAVTTAAQMGVPVAAATPGTHLDVLRPGEDTAMLLGALLTIVPPAVLSGPLTRIAQHEAPGGAGMTDAHNAPTRGDGSSPAPATSS